MQLATPGGAQPCASRSPHGADDARGARRHPAGVSAAMEAAAASCGSRLEDVAAALAAGLRHGRHGRHGAAAGGCRRQVGRPADPRELQERELQPNQEAPPSEPAPEGTRRLRPEETRPACSVEGERASAAAPAAAAAPRWKQTRGCGWRGKKLQTACRRRGIWRGSGGRIAAGAERASAPLEVPAAGRQRCARRMERTLGCSWPRRRRRRRRGRRCTKQQRGAAAFAPRRSSDISRSSRLCSAAWRAFVTEADSGGVRVTVPAERR
jgi:hypothetical protein